MDYAALAKKFGGESFSEDTQPANNTYGSIMDGLSPKDQADIRMKQYADAEKRINENANELSNFAPTISQLNSFLALNKKTSTGSGMETMLPDWKPIHGNDINEMRKIQQGLAPSQRPAGSGSSSDTDVRMFLNALPSADDKGGVNQSVIQRYNDKYNYGNEKVKAMRNYLYKNNNLNGFDDVWQKSPQYQQYMQGGISSPNTTLLDSATAEFQKRNKVRR